MGNSVTTINATNAATPNCHSTMGRSHKSSNKSYKNDAQSSSNPENSRVLFLLYLIHRTWNVVVETVDPKSRR